MPSLADKLKSLGVKMGSSLQTPPKLASQSIDSVVAGSFRPTQLGEVFVSENVYGEGHTEIFLVTEIVKYQALDPNNTNSKFIDLKSKTTISAEELFAKVYRGEKHVTFQTRIEKDGNLSWGRLFIIAVPMSK